LLSISALNCSEPKTVSDVSVFLTSQTTL